MGLKKTDWMKTEFREIVIGLWYATLRIVIESDSISFETSPYALMLVYFHFIRRHKNFMSILMSINHQNVLQALVTVGASSVWRAHFSRTAARWNKPAYSQIRCFSTDDVDAYCISGHAF